MDTVVKLIAISTTKNDFGEDIDTEVETTVFASLQDVGRAEFFKAAELALAPQFIARTAAINYSGQRILDYGGQRFAIYRTYLDGDYVELYCEKKAGLEDGDDSY